MKKMMKRSLALMLAVLMVSGMLPTSAWAARIEEDARPATPVVDEKDGVVDTLAKRDDSVTPVDPVDPDPSPADPSWEEWTIKITKLDSEGNYTITVSSNGVGDSDSSGNMGFALVPDLKGSTGSGILTPTELLAEQITGDSVEGDMISVLQRTGLPANVRHTNNATFNMKDGTAKIEGKLDMAALNSMGTVYDAKGRVYDTAKNGIPMIAILATQGDTPGVAIDRITIGGGIADATWVLNLSGTTPTLKPVVNGVLGEEKKGAYDKDYDTLVIPVQNIGAADVVIAPEGEEGVTVTEDYAVANIGDTAGLTVSGNSTEDLPFSDVDGGTGTYYIFVPYYTKSDDGSYNRMGEATITLIVLKTSIRGPAPVQIVFRAKEGDDTTLSKEVGVYAPTVEQTVYAKSEYTTFIWDNENGDNEDDEDPGFVVPGLSHYYSGTAMGTFAYMGAEGDEEEEIEEGEGAFSDTVIMLIGSWDIKASEVDYGEYYGSGTGDLEVRFNCKESGLTASDDPYEYSLTINGLRKYNTDIEDMDSEDGDFQNFTVPIYVYVDPADEEPTYNFDYVLNFDGNNNDGGTVPSQMTFTGTTAADGRHGFLIPSNQVPTRTGYTFLGWSENSSASSASHQPGQTYIMDGINGQTASKTLYAVWSQNTHKVKYAWGAHGTMTLVGGTAVNLPNDADVAEGATFNVTDVLKSDGTVYVTSGGLGYTFTGWSGSDSNSYTPGQTGVTMGTSDITLTAQWTPKNYTVTFAMNDGTSTNHATPSVQHGTAVSNPGNPTRSGWTFTGWFKQSTGGTAVTDWTGEIITSENVIYYAQWSQNTHTVTYNWNNVPPKTVGGSAITLPTQTPVAESSTFDVSSAVTVNTVYEHNTSGLGYTFKGWLSSADGKTYNQGATITMGNANITLTAQWEAKMYTVTFDKNDGSTGNTTHDTKSVQHGATTTLPTNPTRTGYNFSKWTTQQNGGNNFDASTKVTSDMTVYAQWTPIQYTITWNGNNGTPATQTTNRDYGSTVVDSDTSWPTVTRQYYDFDGWYTDATSGTRVNWDDPVTGPATYYAHWTPKTATITVNIKNKPVSGADTDHNFTGDVKLGNADTYKATIADKATADITVPQSGNSYEIYLDNAATGVSVVPNGDTKTVTVYFYELKVSADGNGTANLDGTSVASGASQSKYYLPNSSVSINATPNTNYAFDGWTGDTGNVTGLTVNTASNTITTKSEAAALTATFNKVAYSATIKVLLNNVQQTNTDMASGTGKPFTGVPTIAVKSGGTSEVPQIAYNTAEKCWDVSNLRTGSSYTVTVTSVTGSYTWDITKEGENVEAKFYGVTVEDGANGNTTNKPFLKTAGTTRAVMPEGQKVTINANPDAGYAFSKWLAGNATNPTADLNTTTTKVTAPGSGDFSFGSDYTTTDGNDLYLKPVYTFSTTIETKYNNTLTGVTSVQVQKGTEAPINASGNNGTYTVSKLDPTATYTVLVNGFTSSVTFGNEKANGTVDVTLYKVKTEVDPKAGGTANVAFGSTIGNLTEVLLPIGASTSDSNTVNIKAAASAGYRLKNQTGETLWTVSGAGAAVASAATTPTTVNITGMSADVTVTAHFVKQWKVTVVPSGNTGTSTATPSIVTTTGIVGSVSGKVATIDDQGVVKIDATTSDEQQVKSWAITKGSGTLYSDSACTNPIGTNYKDIKTVYVKATEDIEVTVTFETRTYDITVTVKKDNAAYQGVTVKLNNTGTAQTTDAQGKATFTVTANTYTVYANGTDTSNTTLTNANNTDKSTTVNATHTDAADLNIEVNYYTVNLAVTPTGGGKVAFGSSAASGSASATTIMLAGTSTKTRTVAASATDNDTTHYRFGSWTVAPTTSGGSVSNPTPTTHTKTSSETYTLPTEADLKASGITSSNQITITATFVQQYKVTVMLADGVHTNEFEVKVKKEGDENWSALNYVMVDAGSKAILNAKHLVSVEGDDEHPLESEVEGEHFHLSEWTIKPDNGAGEFDNSGHTAATKPENGVIGYVFQNAPFTPTKDTVVVMNAWHKPILTGNWTYDKGTGYNTNPKDERARRFTWAKNDAQSITEKTITNSKSANVTFADTDYTSSTDSADTNIDYYTFKEDYLKNTLVDNYTLTFEYTLGADNHPNKVTKTAAGTFSVVASKFDLMEVNVKVENGADTANPSDTNRDTVIYESHKNANIPHSELEFEWYYADTAPTQESFYAQKDGAVAAAEAAAQAVSATKIAASEVSSWTNGTNTIDTGTVAVADTLKGKYIFALVKPKSTSETVNGAVITNSIVVDYDAEITVTKDGTNVGEDHYTVFLVPSGTTPTQADFADAALASKGIVKAGTFASGVYKTTNAALIGNKTYTVYVSDAEGSSNYVHATEAGTVSRTSYTDKTVKYFSVNQRTFTQSHASDNSDTPKPVGETFGDVTIASVTTAAGSAVANGNGVHTGAKVTAKANKWTADYTLTWQTSTNDADLADTNTQQNSDTANGTGLANVTVNAKTNIGGKLVQNTYDVTGDVRSISGSGRIKNATLTAGNDVVFKGSLGNSGTASGSTTATVTFSGVPRNVATGVVGEHYTISAEAYDANTIIEGYMTPKSTTWDKDAASDEVTVSPTETAERFTIFVSATLKSLTVKDEDNKDHTANATVTGTDTTTHTDNGVFANYTWTDKTVTLTNDGNTPLTVTLTITKGSDSSTLYDGSQAEAGDSADDDGKVTFSGLQGKVTLQPGDKETLTIHTSSELNVADSDTYTLEFASVDGRDNGEGGPTVNYIYKTEVEHVTVIKVTTTYDEENNTYSVDKTTIQEDVTAGDEHSYNKLKKPQTNDDGNKVDLVHDDLIYKWYVAPWNAVVEFENNELVSANDVDITELTTADGVSPDTLSFTLTKTEHEGMTLYLLVFGQNNAKGAATTPDVITKDPEVEVEPPKIMNYTGRITIEENTTTITESTGYEVYLWCPDINSGEFNKDTAVKAEWVAPVDSTPGYFKAPELVPGIRVIGDDGSVDFKAYTYYVYTNVVKGDLSTFKDSGQRVTEAQRNATVTYYQVNIDNTAVNQGIYEDEANFTPSDDSTLFLTENNLETALPTAKTTADSIAVGNNGYVLKGTSVTFTYPDWEKDYTLTWGGSASGTAQPNADGSTASVTYNSHKANVTTTLSLNTYDVVANVEGNVGYVDYITMTLTDGDDTYIFTTTTHEDSGFTGEGIVGLQDTSPLGDDADRIAVGKSVTFVLPKAAYTTLAKVTAPSVTSWEYNYNDTPTTGGESVTISVEVTGEDDTYTVKLTGEGLSMTLAETKLPTAKTDTTRTQKTQATIPEEGKATIGEIEHTIHLNYNYDGDQTVTLTLTNDDSELTAHAVTLYENTFADGVNTDGFKLEGFTPKNMAPKEVQTLTVTIPAGLDVKAGGYRNTAAFSFWNDEDTEPDRVQTTITYTLIVVVDPLPFTGVTVNSASEPYKINTYEVTPKTKTAITGTPNDPSSAADTATGLIADHDYLYQWVRAAIGTTPVVTWNNDAADDPLTVTGGNKITENGTSASYQPGTDDEGMALYLVIYARKNSNATGYAISDAIVSGYTGMIKVQVDGTQVTTEDDQDPGYTVKFVPEGSTDGTGVVTAKWDKDADAYMGTLNPEVTRYIVQVSRVQGRTTDLVTLQKTGSNGRPTNVIITNDNRNDTAYYYTVTGKDFEDFEFKTNTGEAFTADEKKFTMAVNGTTLASGTPVLSGQSVTATANGWDGQDYTLTWQTDSTSADNVSVAGPAAADTNNTTASYVKSITAKTYIGGRLNQNTYTVTGAIKNPTGKSGGTVSKVELKLTDKDITFTTAEDTYKTGTFNDASKDGTFGNARDNVTFKVIKGEYEITAYEGASTTISKVTIGGAGDSVVTEEKDEVNTTANWDNRTKETLTPTVTTNDRIFTIYLEGLEMSLTVADKKNHAATSTLTDNNKSTTNRVVYYFHAVDDSEIELTLTNNSSAQLSDITRKVYKLDGGTRFTDSSQLNGKEITDTPDSILTVGGTPVTTLAPNGATGSGGTLKLAANAANTADAVYVVAFTAEGLTVYYVLDLTVDPLPIVSVEAVQSGANMQLKGYAAGTANSGLDNVTVKIDTAKNHTLDSTEAASKVGLVDSDFMFAWYAAPASMDPEDVQNSFAWNTGKTAPEPSDTNIKPGQGTPNNEKVYTPDESESGMNFYLVVYRSDASSNAAEFAVSNAVFAQVNVALKAYRTKTTDPITVNDEFNVFGKMGETEAQAQDGTFSVEESGAKINLTAVQANDTDPAKATHYFVKWGDTSANFSSTTALDPTYTVDGNDTIIGYYDLLPTLSGSAGCVIGKGNIVVANRTLNYAPNDGSGSDGRSIPRVRIEIVPASGSRFAIITGRETDKELHDPREIGTSAFESINGKTPASVVIGTETGNYILHEDWIKNNLAADQVYIITFYDLDKGLTTNGTASDSTANAKGYAGYDRSITYTTSAGSREVTATVAESNKNQGHKVQVDTETAAETVSKVSETGVVTIKAIPAPGYVFNGWNIVKNNGTFLEENGTTKVETSFRAIDTDVTVAASFVAGDFTVTNNQTAKVIYGNSEFETGSKTSVAASEPEAAGTTFTYEVVNTDDQPAWLELNAATGEFSVVSAVNTNVRNTPGATTYTADAVTNEVELTVRITSNAGKSKTVTYTVNVEPGTLEVKHAADQQTATARGEAYVALNTAGTTPIIPVDENGVPLYNETVLKQLFAYEDVHDQAGNIIDNTGKAGNAADNDNGAYLNGTWTVTPETFQGTGKASTYIFTFTYKPDNADEKWNYDKTETNMTLVIATPPVDVMFADSISNYETVKNVLKHGTYSDVADKDYVEGTLPAALDYSHKTFRDGESIIYLDAEPTYTVSLRSVEDKIYAPTLTQNELHGFKVDEKTPLPTFAAGETFASTDGDKEFTLVMTALHDKVWAGGADEPHHAKFTFTGYSTKELADAKGTPDVTATYELTVIVYPKVISSLDVTVTEPETTPEVTAKDKDGTDLPETDPKGNTPVKETEVTWGPDDGPDDKKTEAKVTVEIDPNYVYDEDIEDNTDVTVTDHSTPDPDVERTSDTKVTATQNIPYLMHDDVKDGSTPTPKVDYTRDVSVKQGAKDLGSYTIELGAYGSSVTNVEWTVAEDTLTALGAVLGDLPTNFDLTVGTKQNVELDLSGLDTSKTGTYTLKLEAKGMGNASDTGKSVTSTYIFTLKITSAGGGGGSSTSKVIYQIGDHGSTKDPTTENVTTGSKPSKVPEVTVEDGYVFRGWSQKDPNNLKDGETIELVDPKTVTIKDPTVTFYAIIQERPYHEHYVIGYPNGNFGPADDITRGSVATIIARAILPEFVEGADYGNPGNYSDVSGHWAESAIAYCSKFGVFEGMPDGTFQPNRPISRQEFALVIARLDGVLEAGEINFSDAYDAGDWALDGIYTSALRGWFNGYTDGTFKPLNNIRRDEAVKVFNAYLNRGVDANGLKSLKEYIHSGVASNLTGNGVDEYMTWPDVPKNHWAYYEIIEAANDHEYETELDGTYTVPETWAKCWIDARWRYSDTAGATDGALFGTGFQVAVR